MAEVALAFLWHQHQPYYPDDVAGENPMPWVRLHGVKDYYGMALHLLEFPEMRCTINLVPSLLVQLLAYTDARRQRPLPRRVAHARRRPERGRRPVPARPFLHGQPGADDPAVPALRRAVPPPRRRPQHAPQRRCAASSRADLRDLQVWFNLAWVHPLAFERDDCLRGLRDKGRNFTEDDKNALLDKHLEILREVMPLHRQLAESGQVELTTTPFYHPDPAAAVRQEAGPRGDARRRSCRSYTGGYPEDAAVHVRRAVEQHTQLFGKPPRGMWPAEGSVCQAMLPLLAQHGIRWIATDEEILSASTHGVVSRDGKGHVRNPDRLYRPYKVREGDAELGIVFRDHALSDLIGFHYQRSEPAGGGRGLHRLSARHRPGGRRRRARRW